MRNEFTAIIERDGDWFIGSCAEVPGANGQGRTAEECRQNLSEAIALILEVQREDALGGLTDASRLGRRWSHLLSPPSRFLAMLTKQAMQVSVDLPAEVARRIAEKQPDLTRAVLEAIAIEAVRDRVISTGRAAEMLGVSRNTMDGILKRAQVYLDYSIEDLERDRETHRRLEV